MKYFFASLLIFYPLVEVIRFIAHPTPSIAGSTPSVLTFGYDPMRAGKALAAIQSTKSTVLKRVDFPNFPVDKFMPLYLNGYLDAAKYFPNKRVLIYSDQKNITAFDIDKKITLWRTELPFQAFSTPVISLEFGTIYILTIHKTKNTFYHELFAVKLDGTLMSHAKIKLSSLMFPSPPASGINEVERIHCKTALGINTKVKPSFIYFGCSINTATVEGRQYGSQQGLRGSVIAVELDREGQLMENRTSIFPTSKVTTQDFTGYDSGVYNVGSGPSVLNDGSLLVATGNGPQHLDLQNYGCSVVRVNGNTMKPLKGKNGKPLAFSVNNPPYNECWALNSEYASSAVATVSSKGLYFSAVTRKDGILSVFNPDEMNSSLIQKNEFLIGQSPTYGQPTINVQNNNTMSIYAVSQVYEDRFQYDSFLTNDKNDSNLPHATSLKCIGYLSSERRSGLQPVNILYSGRVRDTYVNAIENTELQKSLTSFLSPAFGSPKNKFQKESLWAPFFKWKTIGYAFEKSDAKAYEAKYISKQLDLEPYLNIEHKPLSTAKQSYFLQNRINAKSCDEIGPGLNPIYKVVRKHSTPFDLGLHVHAINLNYKYVMKPKWHYHNSDYTATRTSPVLAVNSSNSSSILLLSAVPRSVTNKVTSSLIALDGDTGKLIDKISYEGLAHFSMPLVVDDLIFVPTKENGLQVFRAQTKLLKKFIDHTYVNTLARSFSTN